MFYFSDHTAEAPEWYRSWRENYQNYSWSELLVPILFLATSVGYLIAMRRDPVVDDERAARWFRAVVTPMIVLFDLFLTAMFVLGGS